MEIIIAILFVLAGALAVYALRIYDIPTKEEPISPLPQPTLAQLIYEEAKRRLGTDASPKNLAPQELSCAEAVSNILHDVLPEFPDNITSTITLKELLDKDKNFERSILPKPGSIIISPREGDTPGHCGIFLDHLEIASNDSRTGKFETNYTFDSWIIAFKKKRGLHHVYLWEPV